jgi:hypothetical protein
MYTSFQGQSNGYKLAKNRDVVRYTSLQGQNTGVDKRNQNRGVVRYTSGAESRKGISTKNRVVVRYTALEK